MHSLVNTPLPLACEHVVTGEIFSFRTRVKEAHKRLFCLINKPPASHFTSSC